MYDGTCVAFAYDPFGRRIEKTATSEDGIKTTRYIYDAEDVLIELDGSGTARNIYIHGPGIDEPLAMIDRKGATYYHADGLGSIVAMTDDRARTVQEYEYDSFGNLHDKMNRTKQPYTYTGREHDRETGLYYYRARYYDSEVGRFISEDPIAIGGSIYSQGVNASFYQYVEAVTTPYLYTGNDPVNYTDPSGLAKWEGYLHVVAGGEIFGGGLLTGGLKSVSSQGKVTTDFIMVPMAGVTAGLPVSTTGGPVTFETPGAADPNDFIGYVSYVSANAGIGGTGGMTSIIIGDAVSEGPFSFQVGVDASTSGFMGWSFPVSNEGGCK